MSVKALAKSYLKRAEDSESREAAAIWLERAEAEVERGLTHHAELRRIPGRYPVPEQLQLARLNYLRGRLAGLRGKPLREQLRHHARAFELAPERLSAIYTSASLFAMASETRGEEQRQLIKDSFDYFIRYIEFSRHDRLQLAESRELLERNYAGRFPYLEDQVLEARRAYFQ